MRRIPLLLPSLALLLPACGQDGRTVDDTGGVEEIDPSELSGVEPELGLEESTLAACSGAWTPPEELTGEDGLGYHGWTWEDLEFTIRWSMDNRFENRWLSYGSGAKESVRVTPQVAPEAGACLKEAVESGWRQGEAPGAATLEALSAFSHRDLTYPELAHDQYVAPSYDFEADETALYQALLGLHELDNPDPDAPEADDWDADEIWEITQAWSPESQAVLADLVLALGESALLEELALAEMDEDAARRIHADTLDEPYYGSMTIYVSPFRGAVDDTIDHADDLDQHAYQRAALRLASAAEAVSTTLQEEAAFGGGELDLLTPWGRIILRSDAGNDTWTAGDLDDVVLLVDMGGSDVYGGRVAATHHFWMAGSVLVDLGGDDVYGPDTPDVEDFGTPGKKAFDAEHGFTQGAGFFGAAVLLDTEGDDLYMASVWGQGTGAFGTGLLIDHAGADDYRLGLAGQGQGQFGTGILADGGGDDRYGVYTYGQGTGRPGGTGLLLDADGDDTYIAYYQAYGEWLPEPGFPNHFDLTNASMPYNDGDNPHFMSISQGAGWGYRGDWFDDNVNWMGGVGVLMDLGDGDDAHYADNMSMGQGFIYGLGFLYDDGGDDIYRTFWWGPAASAHMGVGLFWEEDGDDDIHVSWASGGFGYDCSVAWMIDRGGNDVYSGQFHYGRAYSYGLTFMINEGGDDEYNADSDRSKTDPYFGTVINGANANLLGAFLDLGGGDDIYNTGQEGVGNDAVWYHEPSGSDVDAERHKGIGIDR